MTFDGFSDGGSSTLPPAALPPRAFGSGGVLFSSHRMRRGVRVPAGVVGADLVRAEAIEQVMRSCADEDVLLALLAAAPATPAAARVVGRLLSAAGGPVRSLPGSPVLTYGLGRSLDLTWRRWCPPAPGSLFAELLLYRDLAGGDPCSPAADFADPFEELEHARDQQQPGGG